MVSKFCLPGASISKLTEQRGLERFCDARLKLGQMDAVIKNQAFCENARHGLLLKQVRNLGQLCIAVEVLLFLVSGRGRDVLGRWLQEIWRDSVAEVAHSAELLCHDGQTTEE